MKGQQIFIAADQRIGFGGQRHGEKTIVAEISAARFYLECFDCLHSIQVGFPAQIVNKIPALIAIEQKVELLAIENGKRLVFPSGYWSDCCTMMTRWGNRTAKLAAGFGFSGRLRRSGGL